MPVEYCGRKEGEQLLRPSESSEDSWDCCLNRPIHSGVSVRCSERTAVYLRLSNGDMQLNSVH